jgi:hypothetical protein
MKPLNRMLQLNLSSARKIFEEEKADCRNLCLTIGARINKLENMTMELPKSSEKMLQNVGLIVDEGMQKINSKIFEMEDIRRIDYSMNLKYGIKDD